MTLRFYTKRLPHSPGTVQLIDTATILSKIIHLPELDAELVCDALNASVRPAITPERLEEFIDFVVPEPAMALGPEHVFQAGFDHALALLKERFEV